MAWYFDPSTDFLKSFEKDSASGEMTCHLYITSQKNQKNNKIMLTRLRLPAKLASHLKVQFVTGILFIPAKPKIVKQYFSA